MNWLLVIVTVFTPTGAQHFYVEEMSMERCMQIALKLDAEEFLIRREARHEGRRPFFEGENHCIPNLWEAGAKRIDEAKAKT